MTVHVFRTSDQVRRRLRDVVKLLRQFRRAAGALLTGAQVEVRQLAFKQAPQHRGPSSRANSYSSAVAALGVTCTDLIKLRGLDRTATTEKPSGLQRADRKARSAVSSCSSPSMMTSTTCTRSPSSCTSSVAATDRRMCSTRSAAVKWQMPLSW